MAIYFHASGQHFDKISPRYSPKVKDKGVFVASSLEMIYKSWTFFAAYKKHVKSQKINYKKFAYKTIYIYKIFVSKEIEKEVIRISEDESFIPGNYFDKIKIIGTRKISFHEAMKIKTAIYRKEKEFKKSS